ncbi:PucR family transcriptional regulator ligand-binding domain-containing protein [Arthrobacter sp. ATA002]|uniref:PucR family transcriptional regulator ligand-binding domain-containing protein n=1 Tax=Arthrobacter sp. ATA002 TaxID=2991715 RepID=UPI0022A7411C|nr:PucR family transcriptional regulator ligand-binding domain-containing protein [Arthrobacter sp. ATA002]WAP50457.1 PucR family transcriptional regulator ligand-binding domain-containing protein [Arthrobacter sp. ATA002]
MLPTVRSVLDLPVLRDAEPALLGSAHGLDQPVRWVHVSEVLDVSGLLAGGELVLTTGLELEKDPGRTGVFVRSLQDAGASGLIVEVTGDRQESLDALALAASAAALPVVVVRRRVRFVQITEIVHRLIVAEQLERVERARAVHEAFTVLSLESAGTQQVVDRAALMIGAPVVLEDLSHLVLAYAAGTTDTTVLLDDWERRSRVTPQQWKPPARVPVTGCKRPWESGGRSGGGWWFRRYWTTTATPAWCWNVQLRRWPSTGLPNGTGAT